MKELQISIPSTTTILEKVDASFCADAVPAGDNLSYGFSVPVLIRSDSAPELRYLPLSRLSGEKPDPEELAGKEPCAVLCNAVRYGEFSREDRDAIIFLAALWDQTEDPLMEATLYSCILLTENDLPVTLAERELPAWLSGKRL
jgi:hypothetical protein